MEIAVKIPYKITPVSKKKKKIHSKRTVSVSDAVYTFLQNFKLELGDKLGGKISFNMVIQALINDHIDLQNVKSELKQIKTEADKTQEYIRDLLKTALSAQPKYIPINQGNSSPPPPPPTSAGIPTISSLKPPIKVLRKLDVPSPESLKTDAEVKQAFEKEKRMVFNGQIRKPSEILAMTCPNHSKSDLKEFDGVPPSLFQKSFALQNSNRFKKLKRKVL
jgi:predicted CopG family antitoxin